MDCQDMLNWPCFEITSEKKEVLVLCQVTLRYLCNINGDQHCWSIISPARMTFLFI